MYSEKTSAARRRMLLGLTAAAMAGVFLLLGLWYAFDAVGGAVRQQAARSVRAAVVDAAVQCYAIEGAYPRSLAYLEENYGVQVNHERFIVTYEAFASNVLPTIDVLEK